MVEAGYAGLPIISDICGRIPEIIDDMRSGVLIHSKSVKEIVNALTFLHTDKAECERLGKALAEKVTGKILLERMVKTRKTYIKL